MNKLTEICAARLAEVQQLKARTPLPEIEAKAAAASPPRGFLNALQVKARSDFALIAEIKKASPSKGLIREDFHPAAHAQSYEEGGAACLSILTETRYFLGSDQYLIEARDACALPALRKDFIVDPWQVTESRALGADAILLIVAALDDPMLAECEAIALNLGMDVLIEVHDEGELARALRMRSPLIGINNRDLRSFVTEIAITERLAKVAPKEAHLVAESGITGHDDCRRLADAGVRSFLVGESLMREADLRGATHRLLHGDACPA